MTECIRLLLVPFLAVVGWLLSRHHTNVARKTARVMSVAATLFLTRLRLRPTRFKSGSGRANLEYACGIPSFYREAVDDPKGS